VLVLLIVVTFIFGLYFSKIKINIKSIEIENISKKFNISLDVNIGILLFGKIKVLGINLFKDGVGFFGKKISYKKIGGLFNKKKSKKRDFLSIIKKFLNKESGDKYGRLIKRIKPKIEEFDIKLNLGFKNVLFTVFAIATISTSIPLAIRNNIGIYNTNKYKYVIMPYYKNSNVINLKLKGIITLKTAHIIRGIKERNKK